MIYTCGPGSNVPEGVPVINVTSNAKDWGREFSPFFLGPCDVYDDYISQTFENLWQYAKVYKHQVDASGDPTEFYWCWARLGWAKKYADRYPMGHNAKPLYSLWKGEKLSYIDARKRIYVPEYAKAARKIDAWKRLESMKDQTFGIWSFDCYPSDDMQEVIENPNKKMGHGFVLKMMLEGMV